MNLNARVSTLLQRVTRGRHHLSSAELAVNFSFVLHEASTSTVVRHAVLASQRHAARKRQTQRETVIDGHPDLEVDLWLVPSLGPIDNLQAAMRNADVRTDRIVVIDREGNGRREITFFRALAQLTLPSDDVQQIGIAALIARPYRRTGQLILRGPFNWTTERDAAIRALEAVIQAHVEQWTPGVQLWSDPAEVALAAEVPLPD